ncbi:DNA-binding protein [Thermosipho melanesiensis]|uniref:DNA-binding protein n=2 Tax=Thermosipho melanesiensis TaxID=46541 RepID=A6LK90_THEM4|nr:DUF177 domain-containing protein [Thermosipho melanesiensis]ABR30341.1 protein of unknown function DUF177 [Thermosipho melanesiensis BI429]APT73507.1 hypothetical protein BW47_02550 [Thermosipho melanesiensis]OOC37457.1 DNA-binding protein [Thermosipho melanesiensis]OOC39662.1 DNA-binding protein [Thermosipho melanesiensis]OOC39691.1 DNA-binding protein [Thermosipho melanesiensis]
MTWKIKIKDIISEKISKIEGDYVTEFIELHTGTYKVIDNRFHVKISIVYTNDTIVVGGFVKGKIERPCDRCLEMGILELEGTIEAIYDLKNEPNFKDSEIENLKNVIYYKGEEIDLEERIIEALVVSAPDVFVCKKDCKGLCPYCGENLNLHPNHQCKAMEEALIDPRFEKLLHLKEKLNNN